MQVSGCNTVILVIYLLRLPVGVVPNLKWSMSLSHTRLLNGGWVREQVITDLPAGEQMSTCEHVARKLSVKI
jgi:hypothetical protein